MQIYISKIDERFSLKIKSVTYLELLIPVTVTIFENIGETISKYQNSENIPDLTIIEGILVNCNVVNNILLCVIQEFCFATRDLLTIFLF